MLGKVFLRELVATGIIILVATFAVHSLFFFAPQDANVAGGGDACYDVGYLERDILGPVGTAGLLFTSYGGWLGCVASGSFANSLYTGEPVRDILNRSMGQTLIIMVLGLVFSGLFAVGIGWFAATSQRPWWRILASGLGVASLIPVYLLAFTLRPLFLGRDGAVGLEPGKLLVMGILLGIANGIFAESVETVGQTINKESAEPYVRSLIARRIPVARHILRSASPVIIGVGASNIPRLVTAVFILEFAFNVHGIGYQGLQAFDFTGRCDVPVILAIVLVAVLMTRVLLGLQRLAIVWLDPRHEV